MAENILKVKVKPGARKTRFVGFLEDGTLKIEVAAPPEKGKANIELLKFLKKKLNMDFEIIQGKKGKLKILRALNKDLPLNWKELLTG